MIDMKRLAKRLRLLRLTAGVSQVELAECAGTSPTTVAQLELGKASGATLRTVDDIGQVLGEPLDVLLRRSRAVRS